MDFVLLMNDLVDLLTSKSEFGKHTEQPIDSNICDDVESSQCEATSFVTCLNDRNGVPLIQDPQKTCVIGFCVLPKSSLELGKYRLDRRVTISIHPNLQIFSGCH